MNEFTSSVARTAYFELKDEHEKEEVAPDDLASEMSSMWVIWRNVHIESMAINLRDLASPASARVLNELVWGEPGVDNLLLRCVPEAFGWECPVSMSEIDEATLWHAAYALACVWWVLFEDTEMCPLLNHQEGELAALIVSIEDETAGMVSCQKQQGKEVLQAVMF